MVVRIFHKTVLMLLLSIFLLFKPSLVNANDDDLVFVTCNVLADGPYVTHGKNKVPASYIPFADPYVASSRLNLFMAHFNPPNGQFYGTDVICLQEFDNNWNGWTTGILSHVPGSYFPSSGGYMGYKTFFNGARFTKISEEALSPDMGNMYNCIITTLQHKISHKNLVVINCQWPYSVPANMPRILDLETRLKTKLSTTSDPCIVCGDFNADGLRTPYDRISAAPVPPTPSIVWANAAAPLAFTSSTTSVGSQKIDYVFYNTQKMQVSAVDFFPSTSAQLLNHTQNNQGATFFSDHCIIRAHFKIPEWVPAPPPGPVPPPHPIPVPVVATPITAAPTTVSVKVPVGTFVPVHQNHYVAVTEREIRFIEKDPERLAAEHQRYPLYWLKLEDIDDSALVQLRQDKRPGKTGAYSELGFFPPSAAQPELLWTFVLVDPTQFHWKTFTYHQHHRVEGTTVTGDYIKYYSKKDRVLKDLLIKLDNYTYYTVPIVEQEPPPPPPGPWKQISTAKVFEPVLGKKAEPDWYWLPVPEPVNNKVLVRVLTPRAKPSLKLDTLDEHAANAKWESNFLYIDSGGHELPSVQDWRQNALYYWLTAKAIKSAPIGNEWSRLGKSYTKPGPASIIVFGGSNPTPQTTFQKHPAEGDTSGGKAGIGISRVALKIAWGFAAGAGTHDDGKLWLLRQSLGQLKGKLGTLSERLRTLKGH